MTRLGNVYRALSGQITRETDKAILFMLITPEGAKSEWFPISQTSSIHRTYDEIEGTFDVVMFSEWLLGQKGWLKYAGAAGTNPVTSVGIVKPQVAKKENTKPSFVDTPAKNAYNRLPYKDDEGPVYNEDDIPF